MIRAIEATEDLLTVLDAEPSPDCVEDMIAVQTLALGSKALVVVTLTRPAQHNALNLAGWRRLARVFNSLRDDSTVRVVIVRGAGGRAFGAGADISEFPAKRLGSAAADQYNAAIASALQAIQSVPFPVIAMIEGLAVGGGCELATACDVRLASTGSRFGIPIGRLGVTLGLTETRAVAGLIGAANLKYLVYSGALATADQALAWGLVQKVVEAGELRAETARLARNIAESSEITVRATKQVTALAADPAVTDGHELIRELHAQAYDGDDLREGVDAFLIGRTPQFTDGRTPAHGRS
ncbi:enoyl-CoA hydratase/isomerase family protein [Arthrobacter sp. 9MFCol3.1]|uniref:enoyl-CoA hydratase/isomerase family protein n=1 Tax=Arthrobacter sp. 9MFCol3.1 TaxID=1150398 RepID=UPI00047A063A|nr:enoyl-CoA hydratase-related protein [Arthrobacter sp. 9MFCol3.1]